MLSSDIHRAATALDPRVKLSFTDHQRPGKKFVFSSSDVKLSIKSLLPPDPLPMPASPMPASTSTSSVNVPPAKKKSRLLEFCSTSDDQASAVTLSDANAELQSYFDQPRLDVDPIEFWAQRKRKHRFQCWPYNWFQSLVVLLLLKDCFRKLA